MNETIENIDLTNIRPSKTNPRKHFDEAYIAELSDSIRVKGILQPLTVRPGWCIGKTDEEITGINGNAPAAEFYEIVAGECRYRGALKAGAKEAPVISRALSDKETLEQQMIENLQRSDLTALEEAEGYRRLINEYGYTVEQIHEKTGKKRNTIYGKLKILKAPAVMLNALVQKLVTEAHCELVGRIPIPEMRERAAREILQPKFLQEDASGGLTAMPDQPMSLPIARGFVRDNYMRPLSGAQFDQKDTTLVAPIIEEDTAERIGGGSCGDCPMRSGNRPELMGDLKRPDICTNPKCFVQKTDVWISRLQETAENEGKKLLTEAESAELFQADGSLRFDCPYVKISEQPNAREVTEGLKRIPSWKKLLEGLESKPQIVIAREPRTGKILELVDRQLAIEAVNLAAKQKNEKSIFDKSKRPQSSQTASAAATTPAGDASGEKPQETEVEKQARKNKEIAKFNFQVTLEGMTALIGAIDTRGVVDGFWDAIIRASIDHAGHDGCWLICKRLGLDPKAENGHTNIEGVQGAALEYGLTLPDEKLKLGFLVELLLSQRVKVYNSGSMGGLRSVDAFKAFAKLYEVEIGQVEKKIKEAANEAKAAKGRAKPDGKIHWAKRPVDSYKFNSNGVCEDPAVLVLPFAKSTLVSFRILVARKNAKEWVTGYEVNYGRPTATGSGSMGGLPAKKDEGFPTIRAAVIAEAKVLLKHLKHSLSKPILKLLEAHIETLKTAPLDEGLELSQIEHSFEHISENKYRCKGCGAAAVKHKGELIVAKEFRGKPCSMSEAIEKISKGPFKGRKLKKPNKAKKSASKGGAK